MTESRRQQVLVPKPAIVVPGAIGDRQLACSSRAIGDGFGMWDPLRGVVMATSSSHREQRTFCHRVRPRLNRLEDRTAPAAGILDPTFGVGGMVTTRFPASSLDSGTAVAVDSLGRAVVAGYTYNGSNNDFAITRYTAAGALDHAFGGTGIVTIAFGASNDQASGVVVDSQNRVVVVGITDNGSDTDIAVARLTPEGALDPSFDEDGKQTITFGMASDEGFSVAVDSLDRVVVAGYTDNGSNFDFAIARLTSAGAPDTGFDGDGRQTFDFGGSTDYATAVAVDSLNRVVVAGYTEVGFIADFAVARLTAAGGLDPSFDGDGKQTIAFGAAIDIAFDVAVDSLDRVVVAGNTFDGMNDAMAVARLTTAGTLDANFDADGKQTIAFGVFQQVAQSVAVDSLNRVVVAGSAGNGSNGDFAIARLTAAGAIDSTFDSDGRQTIAFGASEDVASGVAVDALDRIVVAGESEIGASFDFAVARLTTAGALDGSFDGDGLQTTDLLALSTASGLCVAVDSIGRIVVAGNALNGVNSDIAIARYTAAGALDPSFGGTGRVTIAFGASDDRAFDVAIDSLDRIVVAGSTGDGSNADFAVARLTTAGALDNSFDGDGKQTIAFGTTLDRAFGVAIDSLDRVIVGGYTEGANDDFAVARLTAVGELDASFDGDGKQTIDFGGLNDQANGVAVDSMDRVVLAGATFNGPVFDFAVARLTTAGALDSSFDADGKQTIAFGSSIDYASDVAVDSLDRVVVAGFTDNGANGDFAVARLTAAGALDSGFDGDGKQTLAFGASSDEAFGVAVDLHDRVIVVGNTDNGSNYDFAVARLTAAGNLDGNFDGDGKQTVAFAPFDDFAYGVTVDSVGRVVVAGDATVVSLRFALARLTGDTTVAAAQINDGAAQRSKVTSLTVRFSGQVTFSGQPADAFTLIRNGGKPVTFMANVSVEFGGTVVTLTNFTGAETQFGSLRDGRYTLTALSSQITADGQPLDGDANGAPGGNFVFGDAQGLFRMFGDFNGDRQVDGFDFGAFSSTFNLTSQQAGFLAMFDINGDGQIDGFDFSHFSGRFNTVLP
jgi:uncharacterized delta-60 repeat protein